MNGKIFIKSQLNLVVAETRQHEHDGVLILDNNKHIRNIPSEFDTSLALWKNVLHYKLMSFHGKHKFIHNSAIRESR